MTAIIVQLVGCEKSYDEASKSAASKASNETTGSLGVAGRRRKREEAMSTSQNQQQGSENHQYNDSGQYGGSAPE